MSEMSKLYDLAVVLDQEQADHVERAVEASVDSDDLNHAAIQDGAYLGWAAAINGREEPGLADIAAGWDTSVFKTFGHSWVEFGRGARIGFTAARAMMAKEPRS